MIDLEYLAKMANLAPAFKELIEAYGDLLKPRPASEYHEDMGPVLWWCWTTEKPMLRQRGGVNELPDPGHWLGEPPYVGTPHDLGQNVEITTVLSTSEPDGHERDTGIIKTSIGGWPGYHTHFTPLPIARTP